MKQVYTNARIRTFKDITARHEFRVIEGCRSWRHFAVHEDRAWLLNALQKIRDQVEKVRKGESKYRTESHINTEVQELLAMFEEETLNHIGDEDK